MKRHASPRSAPAGAALLARLRAARAAGVTVLTYASPYSPSHPFSRADHRVDEHGSRERSGGRLRIQPFWSGALLSSEHSMTEMRHGVVDIGLITPIYARGGAHLIHVQAGVLRGAHDFRAAGRAVPLPGARGSAVRPRARRAEGARRPGRQPAGHRHARPSGHARSRTCAACGCARRPNCSTVLRRVRRRSGRHADGRGVFGAGEGRAGRRDRAGRYAQVAAFRRGRALLQHAQCAARRLCRARHRDARAGSRCPTKSAASSKRASRSGKRRSIGNCAWPQTAGEAAGHEHGVTFIDAVRRGLAALPRRTTTTSRSATRAAPVDTTSTDSACSGTRARVVARAASGGKVECVGEQP